MGTFVSVTAIRTHLLSIVNESRISTITQEQNALGGQEKNREVPFLRFDVQNQLYSSFRCLNGVVKGK